ncbi:protein phosphatase 2C-like domain-containing protein 1 [Psammomys obesus]|uniref:protein phosphatase 2C-like domain-containing protein 1 n=1 Tax=Psammomys obesus TaxID=48139 RepID=UPI0024533928|nr:protein phosphatase 2C-like domain-containing protein 1 [Psammomys obesus]
MPPRLSPAAARVPADAGGGAETLPPPGRRPAPSPPPPRSAARDRRAPRLPGRRNANVQVNRKDSIRESDTDFDLNFCSKIIVSVADGKRKSFKLSIMGPPSYSDLKSSVFPGSSAGKCPNSAEQARSVFWRTFSSFAFLKKVQRRQEKKAKYRRSKTSSDREHGHDTYIEGTNYGEMVTYPCSVCRQEISTADIFFHKKHHNALSTLGFYWMGGKKPTPSVISSQRAFVISKLLKSFRFSEKILQCLNYAFELLRQKQIPSHFKLCEKAGQTFTYSPDICHLLIKGVAICSNSNSTWKAGPNGKFTFTNDFGAKANVCFFGLFDGHYGDAAAELASKELQVLFLYQLSKQDPSYQMTAEQQKLINSFHTVFREEYRAIEEFFSSKHKKFRTSRQQYEEIHKAFAKAFWRMDRLLRLGRNEVSRVRWSGCSALTCMLECGINNPATSKDWGKKNRQGATSFPIQKTPQIMSGTLHIANAGNVQAVLCRNGKGFCLTKEHTLQNIKERRRVLHRGAVISSNEPYSFLEGHISTTRGLGFHGNLTLKKFLIPAPQTISVPIDDLCQFLILATNGLWEVLDKKEVTALVITLFHTYEQTYAYGSTKRSDSNIHVLYQYKPEYGELMSTTNLVQRASDSTYYKLCIPQDRHENTSPPGVTNFDACSKKESNNSPIIDNKQVTEKELRDKNFYADAAEYIGCELVSAALEGGSKDSITVMVMFLNGSEYHLLTEKLSNY